MAADSNGPSSYAAARGMPTDFYDVLGVDEDADAEELKRAYRDRAREYHPDLNDGGERATRMFTLVNRAHEVLSEPSERSAYDRLGHDEYVETRLNGLPSMEFDDADGSAPTAGEHESARADDGTAGPADGPSTAARRTSGPTPDQDATPNRERDAGTSASESTDHAGAGRGSAAEAARSSTRASRTGASPGTDARSGSGARSTPGSPADRGTSRSGPATGQSRTGMGHADASRRRGRQSTRRRGLRRAYAAALVAAAIYAAGLVAFTIGVADEVATTLSAMADAPTSTLTAASPLPPVEPSLGTAVGDVAAGTVAADALAAFALPAGAIALPAVLLWTVARYGRGTAWAYALPSLGPAVVLAGDSVLPAATWVDLGGFVVLPALATGAFLFDVGRYLLATR